MRRCRLPLSLELRGEKKRSSYAQTRYVLWLPTEAEAEKQSQGRRAIRLFQKKTQWSPIDQLHYVRTLFPSWPRS